MVSAMKQLEEYVIAMANRTEEADIHEQLMQKEKDLLLAAELGKALLEKNEELSRQNERITEEYTQKLEVRATIFMLTMSFSLPKQYIIFHFWH